MNPDNFSKIVLVWSCEEEDPAGYFLSLHNRQRGEPLARESQMSDQSDSPLHFSEEWFVRERAERLTAKLEHRYSVFHVARRLTQRQIPLLLIVALALLGGFFTDPIGPEGHINLLHFPLLALVCWNMVTYLWMGMRRVVVSASKNDPNEWISNWLTKVGLGISQFNVRFFQRKSPEEKQWIIASLTRFFRLWSSLVGQAVRLQGRSILHWGAAGLAAGVIIGMYLRGFAFEYRASWQSTFLETEQVHDVLAIILFPASMMLGVDFPSVQAMAALKAPGSENAAKWIHLWAVTCLLIIVVPRIGLALYARRKASKQLDELKLPLDEPYFQRLLAPYRGDGLWVEVLPYQCELDHSTATRLEECCLHMFGNGSSVQIRSSIAYGEDQRPMDVPHHIPLRVLVIFDVATTPEQEVHGEFLKNIQSQVGDWPAGGSLLLVILAGAYLKRTDQQRLEQRTQSWQRFTKGYEIEPLFFSPTIENDELLKQATGKLWPTHAQEVL
ncbi:DUF2868 domain-containing protein [Candidatus Nitrospira salsa]